MIFAGIVGLTGLAVIFLPGAFSEIDKSDIMSQTLPGVALAAIGTFLFSLGNMVSRRNAAYALLTASTNAWGMAYGAIILITVIFITDTPIIAPSGMIYTAALLYLAIFGSVIGFTTYLLLVVRVGSSRAAYATVLFPIVALTLSVFFENYTITSTTILGMLLAMAGNIVMFSKINLSSLIPGKK